MSGFGAQSTLSAAVSATPRDLKDGSNDLLFTNFCSRSSLRHLGGLTRLRCFPDCLAKSRNRRRAPRMNRRFVTRGDGIGPDITTAPPSPPRHRWSSTRRRVHRHRRTGVCPGTFHAHCPPGTCASLRRRPPVRPWQAPRHGRGDWARKPGKTLTPTAHIARPPR